MTRKLSILENRRYPKQESIRILSKNTGVKLTTETLNMLAHSGLRLIPPLTD